MLNCVCLALVDAGIPLTAMVAAVEARVVDAGASSASAAGDYASLALELDPTSSEEGSDKCIGTLLHACAWRGGAGSTPSTAQIKARGQFTESTLDSFVRMTTAASATVAAFERLAVQGSVDAAAVNYDSDAAVLVVPGSARAGGSPEDAHAADVPPHDAAT